MYRIKLTISTSLVLIELMIFYVEAGTRLSEKYGDLYEAFYASMENMFYEIIVLLKGQTILH